MVSNELSLLSLATISCFSHLTEAISKRGEVITGRGFAAPPQVKITENYNSPSYGSQNVYGVQNYHHNNVNSYQESSKYYNTGYQRDPEPHYQSYLPQSNYQKLKQRLSTNDQLRSYIKTLKKEINQYKGSERQDLYDYGRNTAVDQNQYYENVPPR